jgi:hypothetical protein
MVKFDYNKLANIPSASLFAFLLIVLCNFVPELLSCKMRSLMNNMVAKHFVGLLLMFFLVIMLDPENADNNIYYNIIASVIIYIWFLLVTRCEVYIVIIILIIFLITYILQKRRDRYTEKDKEYQRIIKAQAILSTIAILLTIIGFILYLIEKRREYGKTFSMIKFIVGVKNCREYTPDNAKII